MTFKLTKKGRIDMLVSMKAILDDANRNNYGVMAMNSINIEMARAGIMAAEEEIAYALQSANISRIFSTLGADPHSLSYFWILPPLAGIIAVSYTHLSWYHQRLRNLN